MSRSSWERAVAAVVLCLAPVEAQQVDISTGSVAEAVADLKPGQYVWAAEIAPDGPMLLIVNLATQRAVLFRNGVPIGASTVSTGRPGYETPTGVFTILEKKVEHYSRKYDNAPMPYMERLTWKGIALHAGHLPGRPASHGCIRMPAGFAKLLYGVTRLGMTVVITDRAVTPRVAPTPAIVAQSLPVSTAPGQLMWQPEKSPEGPVSVVVSAADGRAIVLRNGVIIGSAPVSIEGPVSGSWAYALRGIDSAGQHWVRLDLSPGSSDKDAVPREEWNRFSAPEAFRKAVAGIVQPGMTVVVTADSLRPSSPETVLEGDE
jgi:hypothetical protein